MKLSVMQEAILSTIQSLLRKPKSNLTLDISIVLNKYPELIVDGVEINTIADYFEHSAQIHVSKFHYIYQVSLNRKSRITFIDLSDKNPNESSIFHAIQSFLKCKVTSPDAAWIQKVIKSEYLYLLCVLSSTDKSQNNTLVNFLKEIKDCMIDNSYAIETRVKVKAEQSLKNTHSDKHLRKIEDMNAQLLERDEVIDKMIGEHNLLLAELAGANQALEFQREELTKATSMISSLQSDNQQLALELRQSRELTRDIQDKPILKKELSLEIKQELCKKETQKSITFLDSTKTVKDTQANCQHYQKIIDELREDNKKQIIKRKKLHEHIQQLENNIQRSKFRENRLNEKLIEIKNNYKDLKIRLIKESTEKSFSSNPHLSETKNEELLVSNIITNLFHEADRINNGLIELQNLHNSTLTCSQCQKKCAGIKAKQEELVESASNCLDYLKSIYKQVS